MAGPKVCKHCKTIVESGHKCPNCGGMELADHFKGKVVFVKPEESEIAKNLKIKSKGGYAVRIG